MRRLAFTYDRLTTGTSVKLFSVHAVHPKVPPSWTRRPRVSTRLRAQVRYSAGVGPLGGVVIEESLDLAIPADTEVLVDPSGRMARLPRSPRHAVFSLVVDDTASKVFVDEFKHLDHGHAIWNQVANFPIAAPTPAAVELPAGDWRHIQGNAKYEQTLNLVLVAEGFTASQRAQFDDHVAKFVAQMLALEPVHPHAAALNFCSLFVASLEEGTDVPLFKDECGGPYVLRDTPFNSQFCLDGEPRLLGVFDGSIVDGAVTAHFKAGDPDETFPRQVILVVNHKDYGGSNQGEIATHSMYGGGIDLALHEIGHTIFRLGDEYSYFEAGGEGGAPTKYAGEEPDYPNLTVDPKGEKWAPLISAGALPTVRSTLCDPNAEEVVVAADTVGTFEGGLHCTCGIYRSQQNCKMRDTSAPFCAACNDALARELQSWMP